MVRVVTSVLSTAMGKVKVVPKFMHQNTCHCIISTLIDRIPTVNICLLEKRRIEKTHREKERAGSTLVHQIERETFY